MFMNPIHANIQTPRLWLAEGLGAFKEDAGLKMGFAQLRLVEELLPPIITQEHRIRLALFASLEVCGNSAWRAYAENYLNGNALTLHEARNYAESNEEMECRTYAWKAALYEEVERNSALAMQIAMQYKPFDADTTFQRAYGAVYVDTVAGGRSRETTAFRSSP
jgi:hypothetical protein